MLLLQRFCFGTCRPCVVYTGTEIVDSPALGESFGERKKESDETLLYYLFLREARLLLAHLHHNLGEFGGVVAFTDLSEIAVDVLLIYI